MIINSSEFPARDLEIKDLANFFLNKIYFVVWIVEIRTSSRKREGMVKKNPYSHNYYNYLQESASKT